MTTDRAHPRATAPDIDATAPREGVDALPQDSSASPEEQGGSARGIFQEQGIPDERGIPSVNRVRSVASRVTVLLAGGLAALTALGLLGWYYHRALSRPAHPAARLHEDVSARAQTDAPLPPLGPLHPPRLVPASMAAARTADGSSPGAIRSLLGPPPPVPPVALLTPSPEVGTLPTGYPPSPAASAGARAGVHRKSPRELDLDRRLGGAVATSASASLPAGGAGSERMAEAPSDSPLSAADLSTESGPAQVGSANPTAAPSRTTGSLAALLTPDVTPAVAARVLPTQRFLIPKGAFIDCTLETAIDSTLPGMTTCVTATDTFGADGNVVLLERGTKLVGETRGDVEQGQARVFVLWTEARTPRGVIVPLASPGTDALGRSGLPGAVDRHFFERFGAALLISMIDIGVESATEPRNGGVTVNPAAPETILTEILRSTLNIAPTVHIAQGTRIQVLVARDLDFRQVYGLKFLEVRAPDSAGDPAR